MGEVLHRGGTRDGATDPFALNASAPGQPRAAGGPPASRPTSPWRSPGAVLWLAATLVIALGADLATKWAAFEYLGDAPVTVAREDVIVVQSAGADLSTLLPHPPPVRTVIPGVLDLTLVLNQGAVFGLGAGKRWYFVGFTIVSVGFGLWMFGAWTRARDHHAHLAIGLLLAGGLGNLYDRLVFACVRDFLHPLPGVTLPFGWRMPMTGSREVWPYVSNVADLWLLVGIALLFAYLWRAGKPRGSSTTDAPADQVDGSSAA